MNYGFCTGARVRKGSGVFHPGGRRSSLSRQTAKVDPGHTRNSSSAILFVAPESAAAGLQRVVNGGVKRSVIGAEGINAANRTKLTQQSPFLRSDAGVRSTAASRVRAGGLSEEYFQEEGARQKELYTLGVRGSDARPRPLHEAPPPVLREGRRPNYGSHEHNQPRFFHSRMIDEAPPSVHPEVQPLHYRQRGGNRWRRGEYDYLPRIRPPVYGRGLRVDKNSVRKPLRSTWYRNSASFDNMLQEVTREQFAVSNRLKHLPPVSRRTLRRKERRLMEREAKVRLEWFRDCLHRIARYAPLRWYRGRPPMFDFIEMESLSADPAFRNWEDKVREFKFKVRSTWTRGEVDELRKLEEIGMHYHARFISCLEDMVGRGETVKSGEMVASARVQARVVKEFMRTDEYRTVMERLNYDKLFRDKNKRRAVRRGDIFVWEIYEKVRVEMVNEVEEEVPVVPPPSQEEKKPSPYAECGGKATISSRDRV